MAAGAANMAVAINVATAANTEVATIYGGNGDEGGDNDLWQRR